ncbi:MAG: beta-ketoacyl synthase [Prevotellaceae bacterium]|jgi:3-oxoacyl-[acyl-carrier-protein] synthase-1|nr:beta-ketoacyl synthase [Prevotellaceae bacterium]
MINISGTNIISSLGFTSQENFENVLAGKSGLRRYENLFGLPESVVASLIDRERLNDEFSANIPCFENTERLTILEKAAILSVFIANKEAQIDLSSKKTIFILSTTKGNIELLGVEAKNFSPLQIYLWHSAKTISQFFGNPNTSLVVSNACISGAAAQIAALRELENGNFDYAVVVGADFLSKFIISGFQSFKALSQEVCRPFDSQRNGLNLGEAAATIIMKNAKLTCKVKGKIENDSHIQLLCGAIRNDANHISAPSRVGEGSFRALHALLDTRYSLLDTEIAFINAHGTATPYNDAMEMQAIERAGLQNIPTNSLKAYFGHTLGAAGVLESIISMYALKNQVVIGIENEKLTCKAEEKIENDDCPINICRKTAATDKNYFIKLLSGFGGVNAALLFFLSANYRI